MSFNAHAEECEDCAIGSLCRIGARLASDEDLGDAFMESIEDESLSASELGRCPACGSPVRTFMGLTGEHVGANNERCQGVMLPAKGVR